MGMIFISYRRDDSAQVTHRIFDRLKRHYGEESIFMDFDSIPGGADFRLVLDESIKQSNVLLAVIGKHWIDIKDEQGRRRLDQEDDYVRREIAAALKQGIPVIPLVLNDAQMPSERQLPADLKNLVYKQAHVIDYRRDFDRDMDRLLAILRKQKYFETKRWYFGLLSMLPEIAGRRSGDAPESPRSSTEKKPEFPDARATDPGRAVKSAPPGPSLTELISRVREQADRSRTMESHGADRQSGANNWYMRSGSRITGPFTEDQLRSMRARGEISPIHQISIDRVAWQSAASLVKRLDGALPPPNAAFQPPSSSKTNPQATRSEPSAPPQQWFYSSGRGRQSGPIGEATLRELIQTRRLSARTFVCKAGETRWERIGRQAELATFLPPRSANKVAMTAAVVGIGLILALLLLYLFSPGAKGEVPSGVPGLSRSAAARSNQGESAIAAERFGGVEIGAKGVKVSAVEIGLAEGKPSLRVLALDKKQTVNITISRLRKRNFADELIDDVAAVVGDFVKELQEKLGVPEANIRVVASSGVPFAKNFPDLVGAVRKQTGKKLDQIDAKEEATLEAIALVPKELRTRALVVDIGSGNTKGGVFLDDSGTPERFATVEIPFGTTTLARAVSAKMAEKRASRAEVLREFTEHSVRAPLREKLAQTPEFSQRDIVFLAGGSVWAFVTIMKPDTATQPFPEINSVDIKAYVERLDELPGKYPVVDFKRVLNVAARAASEADYNRICGTSGTTAVFKPDELRAGAALLEAASDALSFSTRTVYFDRNALAAWITAQITPKEYRHLLPEAFGREPQVPAARNGAK
jgi:TIR domain/GYF domain 2/Ppx/GppA phosphatase family